jgi:diguanylate cyclase (GGDEF)-like protein/PAS domain S-box-containing protein
MKKLQFAKSSLARRLMTYVIIASTFIAIFTSGLQIYSAYQYELDNVYAGLDQIEKTHISNITSRVWVLDTEELKTTLNGLLGLPSIQYIAVYDHNELLMSVGEDLNNNVITREHVLIHNTNKKQRAIGKLVVKATLEDTYKHIINQSIIIIGSNIFKTFIVAALILLIFYHLVAKHLIKISEFAEQQDINTIKSTFKYDRKESQSIQLDELDILHNSISHMRTNLASTADELKLNIADRIKAHKSLHKTHKELIDAHDLLQKSEQNLAITLNSIGDAVITTDNNGLVTRMNPVAEQLTGWSFEEADGLPLKIIFPIMNADTREPIKNPVAKVLATGKTIYLNDHTTLTARDGTEYQIADSAAPIRTYDDHMLGMVLVFNDVTESYQLREKAKEARQQMQGLLDDMQTMVSVLETDGTLDFINNTPLKVSGLNPSDVLGNKLWDIAWFKHDPNLQDTIKKDIINAASGKAKLRDIQIATLQGLLWIEFSIHPIFNDKGVVTQLVAEGRDVSQRKAAEDKVIHQAHFDTLTGLPNRFLTLDRLSQLLSEAQRNNELVAILFLDLDDFKKINDTLGHETGDKLLIEASERLKNVVRSGDTVGRLGGDEFLVLLGGLTDIGDELPTIAESLLNRFRDPFRIDGRELMLTASLGIAVYPDDGANTSELLRNADSAMYHAKDIGRNTYSYFTNAMNRDVSRRLSLEEQLHGALNRGEFTVFYQPQIKISSSNIIGAEALLRWHNPALGDVTPNEFIPISEQNGLIVPIGQFVLTEALAMCAQWHSGYDDKFRMAINLSPRQFRDTDLVKFIKSAIKQSGVSGEYLELEITEGVLMSAHSYIDSVLNKLKKLGLSISMDDFGTGYSSLSYLRSYPFDVLKIDQTFIHGIGKGKKNRELISATIAMAHKLNLTVVAEGVETEEQLSFLRELNCDYAQGMLLGKPMTGENLTELLLTVNDKKSIRR